MMNALAIRRFLLRQPRPARLRLTLSTGDVQEMNFAGASKLQAEWSKVAESIAAIGPELIEVLTAEGSLARAVRPAAEPSASDSGPDPPKVLSDDPETARLTHFANLIHRAYEHSTVVAFGKLVELVERIDARSDSIEQRLERTESAYRKP
jgi:hypothetical protein